MTLNCPFRSPILRVCQKVRGEALDVLHEHLSVFVQTHTILDSLWRPGCTTRMLRGLQRLEMSIALDELPSKAILIMKIIPGIPHLTEFIVTCSEPTWSTPQQSDGTTWLRNEVSNVAESLLIGATYEQT